MIIRAVLDDPEVRPVRDALTTGATSPRSARELLLAVPLRHRLDRAAAPDVVRVEVAETVRGLAAELGPVTSDQSWLERWKLLAALGRTDLVVARLVEGHLDALAILQEAGREPRPDALYGVWASASGGTGLQLTSGDGEETLEGTMRFCSGARTVDRVLATATNMDGGLQLVDVAMDPQHARPDLSSWPALGMDASDSFDLAVDGLPVWRDDLVGPPGFYLERPGLPLGGIGVAAVWLGGSQGLLDATLATLDRHGADDHQLAHVGAVTVAIEAAAATLVTSADLLGPRPVASRTADMAALSRMALTCRSAVEAAVGVTVQRLPRVAGPVAMSRDADFAHRLADLEVYVRQHHGERDLARLGAAELEQPWSTAERPPAATRR